jgi:hypothetical protein
MVAEIHVIYLQNNLISKSFVLAAIFFLGPLKKNPAKIWGANPPLSATI